MKILAIETSCDETAAAVVEEGTKILSNVVASSTAMQQKYGGIVPELAAREQLRCIIPVITEALQPLTSPGPKLPPHNYSQFIDELIVTQVKEAIEENIGVIAVTVGPGLIGSLLVGVETAKTMALVTGKPIIPVNHVVAHMYANFVHHEQSWKSQIPNPKSQTNTETMQQCHNKTIEFPAISLVASGGHTELYLMESIKKLRWLGGTLDDAAGEAFDKTARLLGFGSRGGVAIQEAARKLRARGSGLGAGIKLPRPMINDESLNFSFSGLKTAILREVNKLKSLQQYNNKTIKQLAFEVQEAITDVLVEKTLRAAQTYHAKSILLSGGVAANTRLREKFHSAIQQYNNITIYVPEARLCTDNAAYIAACAYFRGKPRDWRKITALPDLPVEVSE